MTATQKNYHCDTCGRSFARTEHLDRHRRIHTREKPYSCAQCALRFSRTDLLRRHELSHHALDPQDTVQGRGASERSQPPHKRQRTKVACDNCNSKKLKCDSDRPCGRCRARNTECTSSNEKPVSRVVTVETNAPPLLQQANSYELPSEFQSRMEDSIDSSTITISSQTIATEELTTYRNSITYPQTSILQEPSSLDQTMSALQWVTANVPATAGAANDAALSTAPNATDGNNRYVHFSPQVQMLPQQIPYSATVLTPDFDFASLGQNKNPAEVVSFYDQEGWSNLFPGIDTLYDSFPMDNGFDGKGNENTNFETGLDDMFDTSFFPLQDIFPNTSPSQDTPDPRSQYNHAASVRVTASVSNSSDPHTRFEAISDLNASRPQSPSQLQERNKWISGLGKEDSSAYLMDYRAVIDEFLWLFHDRVSGWFSCFRDLEIKINRQTRKEWYLAMAAVGALFSHTDGSNKIAKWLYHCARQKLFSFVYGKKQTPPTVLDAISVVETYMLLELFGYLSGDKRLYELTEALHGQMIQTLTDLNLFRPNPSINDRRRQNLIESLLVFDCYRVVLIQRPPVLQLFPTMESPKPVSFLSAGDADGDELAKYLRAFTSPGSLTDTIQSMSESYGILCSLALMTWNVVPPPFSRDNYSKTLWSSSFCELALNEWVSAHDTLPSTSVMLLFHAIHINMFVCLPTAQNLMVSYLNRCAASKKTSLRPQESRGADRLPEESALRGIFSDLQSRPKAVWHARKMLLLAQQSRESTNGLEKNNPDNIGGFNCPQTDRSTTGIVDETEAPHFSYCVTFAVVVLWCDAVLTSGRNEKVSSKWPDLGSKLLQDPTGDCSRIRGLFRNIFTDMVECAAAV